MFRSLPRAAVACALLGLILASGCSESEKPNTPPTVRFTMAPSDSATVTGVLQFAWSGMDADGRVAGFQVSLDDEEFYDTPDSSIIVPLTKEDGSDTDPQLHMFLVRAVDDRSLIGEPDSSVFWVAIFNEAPQVALTSAPPQPPVYAGSMVSFEWEGSDADGQVAAYEYRINEDDWQVTTETSTTVDFSSGDPEYEGFLAGAHEPEIHTFSLRAQDDNGKYSVVVATEFLAGPENQGPTVTLLSSPPLPQDAAVTQPQVTWTWSAQDPDGTILNTQYALDLDSEADWLNVAGSQLIRNFKPADGYFDDPQVHTFYLRCRDNDSTYSAVVMREFELALANTPPVVAFVGKPDPNTPQSYRKEYKWTGTDDLAVDHYEYAVDDTSSWISTTSLAVVMKFSAPNVNANTCGGSGCQSFGNHMVYVKAVDTYGLESATEVSELTTFTFSPVTTIQTPAHTGGEVSDAPAALDLSWSAIDTDGAGAPVTFEYAVLEVADFASHPTPDALQGATWNPLGPVTSTMVNLDAGKMYLLGLRATDEALAVEPILAYGKNALKITVAGS